MDLSRTSPDLLAHFEPPATQVQLRSCVTSRHGVPWVLKWAAAACVLFYAICLLAQLGYCIATERTLAHAARAGALEATLPRATRESIVETVERRLIANSISIGNLQIVIQQNGTPARSVLRLADNDRISVALSVAPDAVLPAWMNAIPMCYRGARIEARAERLIPSRRLH